MCHHAIEKVLQLALGTFAKTDNFAHKLEKLVTQTSLLTGFLLHIFFCGQSCGYRLAAPKLKAPP